MSKATRGSGKLENLLAKLRRNLAKKYLPKDLVDGSILDIGCGSEPVFLESLNFKTKYGIDRVCKKDNRNNIHIINTDVTKHKLPFKSKFFNVITSLAFIEHITYDNALTIFTEAYRVLKNDGTLIITTPSRWTDLLLRILSKFGLVSKEEINEHKVLFTKMNLKNLLIKCGFDRNNITVGNFELGMNIYAVAKKN